MVIYLGADHKGFALKEKIKESLKSEGYEVVDEGAKELNPNDDYADFASAVARQVGVAPEDTRGIVVCGSGFGVDATANKTHGVRSGIGISPDQVYAGRHDDDINVLAVAADFIDEPTALNMVKIFLATPFAKEERFVRRIGKIE